jgi:hypothetical protein
MVPGESDAKRIVESKIFFWTERNRTMEDRAPRKVFADDMGVTSRYWETVIRQSYSQPEKELMLAVLKDALLTYKKCIYSGNALFKEAETWLFEREPDRLYAFETVCAVLGLSAEKLRHNLLAWKLNALSDLARGRHLGADRMAS